MLPKIICYLVACLYSWSLQHSWCLTCYERDTNPSSDRVVPMSVMASRAPPLTVIRDRFLVKCTNCHLAEDNMKEYVNPPKTGDVFTAVAACCTLASERRRGGGTVAQAWRHTPVSRRSDLRNLRVSASKSENAIMLRVSAWSVVLHGVSSLNVTKVCITSRHAFAPWRQHHADAVVTRFASNWFPREDNYIISRIRSHRFTEIYVYSTFTVFYQFL